MIILYLSFIYITYPFAIGYLSFCNPILYLSILGFRLRMHFFYIPGFAFIPVLIFSPFVGKLVRHYVLFKYSHFSLHLYLSSSITIIIKRHLQGWGFEKAPNPFLVVHLTHPILVPNPNVVPPHLKNPFAPPLFKLSCLHSLKK